LLTHVSSTTLASSTYNARIHYDPLGRYIGYSPNMLSSRQVASDGDRIVYIKRDNDSFAGPSTARASTSRSTMSTIWAAASGWPPTSAAR
jgi:hypothetical protein